MASTLKVRRPKLQFEYPGLYRVNPTTSAYVMKSTKTQPMSMHVGPCLEMKYPIMLVNNVFFPYYNQL